MLTRRKMASPPTFLILSSLFLFSISNVLSDSVNINLRTLVSEKCGSENNWSLIDLKNLPLKSTENEKGLRATSFSCASLPFNTDGSGTLDISVYYEDVSGLSKIEMHVIEYGVHSYNYVYSKSNKDFVQGWNTVSLPISKKTSGRVTLLGFSYDQAIILITSIQIKNNDSLNEQRRIRMDPDNTDPTFIQGNEIDYFLVNPQAKGDTILVQTDDLNTDYISNLKGVTILGSEDYITTEGDIGENESGEDSNGGDGGGEDGNGGDGGGEDGNGGDGVGEDGNGGNGGGEDGNGGSENQGGGDGGSENQGGGDGEDGESVENGGGGDGNGGDENEGDGNGGDGDEGDENGENENEGNESGEQVANNSNSFWNIWTIVLVSVGSVTVVALVVVSAYYIGKMSGKKNNPPEEILSDIEAPRIIPRVQSARPQYDRFGNDYANSTFSR